jgi:hypothetical protein
MSNVLDSVFPEPDGEWIGAEIFAKSKQKFKDFESLQQDYGYAEKTAAKIALSEVCDWSEEVRYWLRGY